MPAEVFFYKVGFRNVLCGYSFPTCKHVHERDHNTAAEP